MKAGSPAHQSTSSNISRTTPAGSNHSSPNNRTKSPRTKKTKNTDDENDITIVNHSLDLLLDPKYDTTTRLYRFLRHMGSTPLAEIADLTGAVPIWFFLFTTILTIPYIILTSIAKIALPWYLVVQQGRFCDIPLDSYLYLRFAFDTLWYLLLLFPISSTFNHWRILFVIDAGLLLLTAPLVLSPITQGSLCPQPLIALATVLIAFQLITYAILMLCIVYRVIFVTKDPYHPGFYPTRDEETGTIMGETERTDRRGIIERTFDFLKGNITYLGDKEYGRIGQASAKKKGNQKHLDSDDDFDQEFDVQQRPTSPLTDDDDDDDDDDLSKPETFGFGNGQDDSDLSDLESGVAF